MANTSHFTHSPAKILFASILVLSLLFAADVTMAQKNSSTDLSKIQQDIKTKQDAYRALQDKATLYKENLKSKQQEKSSLNNQIEILDQDISLTETELEQTQNELEQLGLEQDRLEIEIQKTQKNVDSTKGNMGELLRDLYNYNQQTYLEIALRNTSLSEYSSQVQYTETLNTSFQSSLQELLDLKKSLKDDKNELAEKEDEENKKKEELDLKKISLAGEIDSKNFLLNSVEQDEAKFQSLVDEVRKEQDQINADITSLQTSARQKFNNLSTGEQPQDGTIGGSTGTGSVPSNFNPDWPLVSHYVTAYFKDPTYPYRSYFEHSAIDIATAQGSPIRAADGGIVSVVRYDGTTRYAYITIVHADNFQTLYGHVSQVYVQPDQVVEKGDIIAASGASPGTIGAGSFTTGPHLHFEVWLGNVKVDPLLYLP